MSILSKTKNQKEIAQQIAEGDESGLFWIDEKARKQQLREHKYALDKMIIARNTFQEVTGEKITTYADFQAMVADPAAYFRKNKAEKNITEKKPMTLALIGEGYDVDFLEEQLALPDGFDEVEKDCGALLRERFDWSHFSFDGKAFTLSTRLINRMINRVFYFAPRQIQKKRLELANKFKALIPEWIELLKLEAEEAGIHSSKVQKAINSHRFLGPLPFCLKLDRPINTHAGWFDGDAQTEVMVNPDFVVNGHVSYADQIGLPGLRPSPTVKKWEDSTVYKRFWATAGDGGRRPHYVKVGLEKMAYAGAWRDANIKFDDGEFVIRDGKFVMV